jgi:hypothetical protein
MASVEVVGVYPVDAPEPCHLVELVVRGSDGRFDVGSFTQPDEHRPKSDWQVPYAEKLLDSSGEDVAWDFWDGLGHDRLWEGDVRLVFFFHHLDLDSPLVTPFGEVTIPSPTPRPGRLAVVEYEEP